MALKFDEVDMRERLKELYQKFLEKPEDENIKSDLVEFDRQYGGLASYNDYLASKPIPEYISKAIGHISTIYQYGWGTYEDKWILDTAKKNLEELQKNSK
ncbi:MAG: hypothetical protein ABEJ02_02580 [Candidatus Paceibacteria bacterium]